MATRFLKDITFIQNSTANGGIAGIEGNSQNIPNQNINSVTLRDDLTANDFLNGTGSYTTVAGGGDVSSNTGTSVVNTVAKAVDTSGKLIGYDAEAIFGNTGLTLEGSVTNPNKSIVVSDNSESQVYALEYNFDGSISDSNFTGILVHSNFMTGSDLAEIRFEYTSLGCCGIGFYTRVDATPLTTKRHFIQYNGEFQMSGGLAYKGVISINANYSLLASVTDSDYGVFFVNLTANRTCNLPQLSGDGLIGGDEFEIQGDGSLSGTASIIISPNGTDTIEGVNADITLKAPWDGLTLKVSADKSTWIVQTKLRNTSTSPTDNNFTTIDGKHGIKDSGYNANNFATPYYTARNNTTNNYDNSTYGTIPGSEGDIQWEGGNKQFRLNMSSYFSTNPNATEFFCTVNTIIRTASGGARDFEDSFTFQKVDGNQQYFNSADTTAPLNSFFQILADGDYWKIEVISKMPDNGIDPESAFKEISHVRGVRSNNSAISGGSDVLEVYYDYKRIS